MTNLSLPFTLNSTVSFSPDSASPFILRSFLVGLFVMLFVFLLAGRSSHPGCRFPSPPSIGG